jgi:hypothetical protein
MRQILFVFLLILCIYPDDKIYSNNSIEAIYGNITNINWQIESIVTKKGTNDPDEIVPANQITIIDTGNIINGVIYFRNNKTITIKDSDPQFYLNYYEQYHWELVDNNFIQFKRFGNDGRIVQSFGYKVFFTQDDKMKWIAEGVGIESGQNSVRVITLYHK